MQEPLRKQKKNARIASLQSILREQIAYGTVKTPTRWNLGPDGLAKSPVRLESRFRQSHFGQVTDEFVLLGAYVNSSLNSPTREITWAFRKSISFSHFGHVTDEFVLLGAYVNSSLNSSTHEITWAFRKQISFSHFGQVKTNLSRMSPIKSSPAFPDKAENVYEQGSRDA